MLLSTRPAGVINLNRVKREISPEPSREELEAIEEALARLTAPPADPRSAWWRAGLVDDLSREEGLA